MTYRSDHDAALARVASLEAENAALKRKLSVTPTAPETPNRRRYWPLVTLIPVVGFCAAVFTVKTASGKEPATTESLERCAKSLAPKPILDEKSTDPRGGKESIAPILKTTGCRSLITERMESGIISNHERRALAWWLSAEEALANEVSLIETYYGSDPYSLDNYASAGQLWTEYDHAYFARQRAIDNWRDQTP